MGLGLLWSRSVGGAPARRPVGRRALRQVAPRASSFDRIGSCPYRGASGWRSQVAPNDKQLGVGACHSLDLAETLHQTRADFACSTRVVTASLLRVLESGKPEYNDAHA